MFSKSLIQIIDMKFIQVHLLSVLFNREYITVF